MTDTELCGAWGGCTLPAGHNLGRVDIPSNHQVPPTPDFHYTLYPNGKVQTLIVDGTNWVSVASANAQEDRARADERLKISDEVEKYRLSLADDIPTYHDPSVMRNADDMSWVLAMARDRIKSGKWEDVT